MSIEQVIQEGFDNLNKTLKLMILANKKVKEQESEDEILDIESAINETKERE